MKNHNIDSWAELLNCNNVKAILMIIVVLCHCMSIYSKDGWGPCAPAVKSDFFDWFAAWLGTFHVYGFTLISGYIFYYVKFDGGGV